MRWAALILVVLALSQAVLGQGTRGVRERRASIAFWNVENLYDTIRSPFYDDSGWTPRGAKQWNTERYKAKIENIARVIDAMAADIVGLAEVENEGVVRDLVRALATDYNYIHRSSGDGRGMDVALLYKGDKFFPDTDTTGVASLAAGVPRPAAKLIRSGTGREFLHVEGALADERIHLIICHMASNLNEYSHRRRNMEALRGVLDRLLSDDPAALVVVAGDMNARPDERVVRRTIGSVRSPLDFVHAPHWEHHRTGRGSYNWRGRWMLYDWMMVSPALARRGRGGGLKLAGAGIFAQEWMTEPSGNGTQNGTQNVARRPRRTFQGGAYTGGYSDHFPVWITLRAGAR